MPNILDSDRAVSQAWHVPVSAVTKPGIHSYNARRRSETVFEDAPAPSPFPWIRTLCLLIGLACVGYYGFTLADDFVYQRYENWAFDQHMAGRQAKVSSWLMETTPLGGWMGYRQPATSKPSETRQAAGSRPAPSVPEVAYGSMLGRVVIPRLGLRSVVREGADENTLRRAVGHVPSTQLAGAVGNFAIAAHRDTLFRALKDIKIGDRVSFESPQGTFNYKVISTKIVKPSDVSVLEPRGSQKLLTMITCYPFYYVGSAPKRFIVTAQLDDSNVVSLKSHDASPASSPTQVPAVVPDNDSPTAAVPVRSASAQYARHQTATRKRLHRSSHFATRNRQPSSLRHSRQRSSIWHKLNLFRARQTG